MVRMQRQRHREPTMTYEDYLEHVEECERLADMATLPSNRHALLSTAEMWRMMAADKKPMTERDRIPG
jgi:hypothetical protein